MSDGLERLGEALADRYRLDREVGQGGMATVYLAQDLRHDRRVALKLLRPDVSAVLGVDRFLSEIRTTARLNHPRILPLLDSGRAGDAIYYVMPLVEGDTLRTRLERQGRLGLEETVGITRALASALDYAHANGVVHRDIKPENILFQAGEPVLADFGIALALSSAASDNRLTGTGMSLGTPRYMSPEQASGDRLIDARSDVYALGCLVYEMLSGRCPHDGQTVAAIIVRVLTEEAAPLSTVVPGIHPALELAVGRALAKAPQDRYETTGTFAVALAAALPAASVAKVEKSIVVLPFDNMSPEPNDAYLAEGLTEELISDLSRIRAFRVISRNSSVAAKARTRDVREVARLLDVRYVLEGSVRRAGDSLRITAQLIDGATDAHLWTDKYSGTMQDVFAMQESVSRAIVQALEVVLTPEESRQLGQHSIPDLEAWECYLRARQQIWEFTLEATSRAIALLNEAEAKIGASAILHAARAWVYFQQYNIGPTPTNPVLPEGLALAKKALELDSSCALAWAALGFGHAIGPSGSHRALQPLRRALELDPGGQPDAVCTLALCLAVRGEVEEAEATIAQARRLDPLGGIPALIGAYVATFNGDFAEAERRILAPGRQPEADFLIAFALIMLVYVPQRRTAEIGTLLHQWQAARDEMPYHYCRLLHQALLHGSATPREFVTPAVENGAWYGDATNGFEFAQALALMGDADRALLMLEHIVDVGWLHHDCIAHHTPAFEFLRDHPRFQALLARVKASRSAAP